MDPAGVNSAMMADPSIIALLAEKLRTGLIHPGDPNSNKPAVAFPMPFRTSHLPKQLADQAAEATRLWAEAIVAHIENDGHCTIINTAELEQLRNDAATPAETVTVHCRKCDKTAKPLLVLSIRGKHTMIDGRQLITTLSAREPECPHKPKP